MPELPDVEGYGRVFDAHARGRTVKDVKVLDAGVLHGVSARSFVAALKGLQFKERERQGKWLFAPLECGPLLVFHFGMTGGLFWSETNQRHPYDRVLFSLEAGTLVFRDLRKLQGLWLAADEEAVHRITGPLGPDALGLKESFLAERLSGRRGAVKTALTDQRIIAGIGNILADEVLWRSCIHPARRCDSLARQEFARLSSSLQRVLRTSVKAGHIPRRHGWLAAERGKKDPFCPRCGTHLLTSKLSGRTALWCPRCQAPINDEDD